MSKRLLITGSRRWEYEVMVEMALEEAIEALGGPDQDITLVEGGAVGADKIAAEIWRKWKRPVETHRADWSRLGRAAGPVRNQEMVDAGADLCLAFILPDSSGTLDCARRARLAGINVLRYTLT